MAAQVPSAGAFGEPLATADRRRAARDSCGSLRLAIFPNIPPNHGGDIYRPWRHSRPVTLIVKRVDEDQRVIEGIASSATTDTAGDPAHPARCGFRSADAALMRHNRAAHQEGTCRPSDGSQGDRF